MAAVLRKTITLPNLAIFTVAEAWLSTRVLPSLLLFRSERIQGQYVFLPRLFALLLVNIVLFVLYKVFIYNVYFSTLKSFPRPKSRRTLTGFYDSVVSSEKGNNLFKWASDPANTEGVLLLPSPMGNDVLVATGPKALQEILLTNTYDWEKPSRVRNFLRHILGDGLIIVEGDQHKFQRKQIKPAFGFRQVKDLYPMMWKKAIAVNEAIHEDIKTDRIGLPAGSTEIGNWASKVTLDIIGVAGLGREFNSLKNTDDSLVQVYEDLLTPSPERALYFAARTLVPDGIITRIPWRMNTVFKKSTTELRRITRDLVRDKRQAMKVGGDEHFDILSLLINTGDFSDDDLSDQLLTFLAAGHETTSSAFTWTVFLLATHPEIQNRAREEIHAALSANPTESPDCDLAAILESLPLLNGIANETLRLYPTVPSTIRRSSRDTTLLGRVIPAGTDVVLAPWATNRLASLWGADGSDFVPDRWINKADNTPNNSGGVDSNYSFLTFLHGPRSCIGQGFAKAELRCLIAAFVGRYEWRLDMKLEDVIPGGAITIKPRNGLIVKLREVGSAGRSFT